MFEVHIVKKLRPLPPNLNGCAEHRQLHTASPGRMLLSILDVKLKVFSLPLER
jgi:hypothetical protein